jgi:nucleoid-associated protein YgaU
MAKNGQSGNSKASNSNPNNPNQGPNGAKGVDLNPPVAGRDEKGGIEKSPSFKTHIVQKNETLESIAKKELGARGKWTDLAKANEGLDPKKLKIGQSILVPVVEDLDLREAAESAADKSAPIKAVKKNAKENTIAAKSTR